MMLEDLLRCTNWGSPVARDFLLYGKVYKKRK